MLMSLWMQIGASGEVGLVRTWKLSEAGVTEHEVLLAQGFNEHTVCWWTGLDTKAISIVARVKLLH
jgi:hypothetical protein